MTYCIAVFKSRSQAADCKILLERTGVWCELIETPARLGLGCGLSVKLMRRDYARAKRMIDARRYSAMYGYMQL